MAPGLFWNVGWRKIFRAASRTMVFTTLPSAAGDTWAGDSFLRTDGRSPLSRYDDKGPTSRIPLWNNSLIPSADAPCGKFGLSFDLGVKSGNVKIPRRDVVIFFGKWRDSGEPQHRRSNSRKATRLLNSEAAFVENGISPPGIRKMLVGAQFISAAKLFLAI